MRRRQRVGTGLMHPGMDHKRRTVDCARPFDHIALVINQNESGRLNFAESHSERIHPETLRVFRVSHRYVTCDAFGEAESTEQPEPGGELLLADRREFRSFRAERE